MSTRLSTLVKGRQVPHSSKDRPSWDQSSRSKRLTWQKSSINYPCPNQKCLRDHTSAKALHQLRRYQHQIYQQRVSLTSSHRPSRCLLWHDSANTMFIWCLVYKGTCFADKKQLLHPILQGELRSLVEKTVPVEFPAALWNKGRQPNSRLASCASAPVFAWPNPPPNSDAPTRI